MRSKNEFINYYTKLVEHDEGLKERQEKIPKKSVGKTILKLFIALIIIDLVIFLIISLNTTIPAAPFFPISLIVITFVIIVTHALLYSKQIYYIKYFDGKYKEKLIDYLLEDKSFTFNKEEYIPSQDFKASEMFFSFDRYRGEDLLKITFQSDHGQINLNCSDLDVERETEDSDGNTRTSTVFRGIFGYVELEKKIDFGLGINHRQPGYERVKLESVEFNKKFKIYSTDQVSARLVWTPDRMDKMLNKYKHIIKVNVVGEIIYFAISNANLFNTVICSQSSQINVDDFYNDVKIINDLFKDFQKILNDIF